MALNEKSLKTDESLSRNSALITELKFEITCLLSVRDAVNKGLIHDQSKELCRQQQQSASNNHRETLNFLNRGNEEISGDEDAAVDVLFFLMTDF